MSAESSDEPCCKVGRAIRGYDLQPPDEFTGTFDDYLATRWIGRGVYEETGLRGLTDWMNRKILRRTYTNADRIASEAKQTAEYEALRGRDPEGVDIEELETELREIGIDPDELRKSFVAKSTLYRHLNDHVGASKDSSPKRSGLERLEYAQHKALQIADHAKKRLDEEGTIKGAAEANLDFQIIWSCPHCNIQVRHDTAVQQGFICEHLLDKGEDPIASSPTAREVNSAICSMFV